MKQAGGPELRSTARLARAALILGGILIFSGTASRASAQSKSGFIYNGMDYTSYAQTEYLEIPQGPNSAQALRAAGANYSAVMATWYLQTYNSTSIASSPSSPSDADVAAAIQNLRAQGITVTLKPHVDSLDGIWRGDFTWPSSAVSVADQQAWLTAWFTSYQAFIMHFAQIASVNGVGTMVIGTEFAKLTGSDCAGSCRTYWDTYVINPLRAKYPNLTLAYGADADWAGDEFTTVSFWEDVDIIGLDGYVPLTSLSDPTVAQLVAAWTNAQDNVNGFNPLAAFQNLQSAYDKPLIFTEIGYMSTSGSNQNPANDMQTGSYDPTEQQNCYEAFFEVFSAQSSWMKGVFWWAWTVSPPGADERVYSPQNKPTATATLPEWYGSTTAGFTLAPSYSTLSVGQGLTTADTVSVTPLGGFSGSVNLSVAGLPAGVTASFGADPATGISVLSLSASGGATAGGPVALTVTGTSGSLAASTTIALRVTTPESQAISFPNPGSQSVGTRLSLAATASSGLPVVYASATASVCAVSGSVATLANTGECTIEAAQAGNYLFSAAPPVSENFQVVSFPPVAIPKNREVVVSQTNWLASLGAGGNAYVALNPDGSSFAINSNGAIVEANTTNLLLFDAQSGASTTLGAWGGASAVAVDSNNDIYVGNLYTYPGIVRLPYLGGSANGGYAPFTTPSTSLPACTSDSRTECVLLSGAGSENLGAMAFDSQGNLFLITAGNGGNGIWECNATCLAGSGTAIQLYQEPVAPSAPSPSSGQLTAGSLAIDSSGNIFFTDSSVYVDSSYSYHSFFSRLNELPVSAGGNAGFAGNSTGYSASPIVLYTLTPSQPPIAFGNQLDAVAIARNAATGDTVYFGNLSGVFAFPDTGGGMIPTANGQPTALHMVSPTGVKVLAADSGGNLYFEAFSSLIQPAGGDAIGQITIGNVAVPASAVGAAVSPSATLHPVAAMLNDTGCAASLPASVTFAVAESKTASAALSVGSCSTTASGGAFFPVNVSFTPRVAGNDNILLTGTDQLSNTGTVTVSGIGAGPAFITSAQDAESGRTSFTSGQWVGLYGSSLANTSRTWATSDFTGGTSTGSPLPSQLSGVSVTIGGQAASVYYISPTQLNVLSPTGLTPGSVPIVVTNNGSVSPTFTATVVQSSPSFFYYAGGGNLYPLAVHVSDGALVGDPAVVAGTEKAHPGETLEMFANGIAAATGGIIVPVTQFPQQVSISAGSTALTTSAPYLVSAGEFQVNATLPSGMATGNYTLTLSVPNGSTSTSGVTITLPVGP